MGGEGQLGSGLGRMALRGLSHRSFRWLPAPWAGADYELRGKGSDMRGAAVSEPTFWYCAPTTQLSPSPREAMSMGPLRRNGGHSGAPRGPHACG